MAKKAYAFVLVLLVAVFSIALAIPETSALFESVAQCTTDELLQLRDLIDTELQSRGHVEQPVFILNINTRRFHLPDCQSVKDIKDKNRMDFFGARDELIGREFQPCKNCNP